MSKSESSQSNSQHDPEFEEFIKTIDPALVDPADFNISYDPACVQRLGNFGSTDNRYLFDHKNHELLTRENVKVISPKLLKIIEEIERQDDKDMKEYGKKFKHFVFSNVKSGTGGAKIIATALSDILGMKLGYSSEPKEDDVAEDDLMSGGASKNWKKIRLHSEEELMTNKFNNFFLLSSVGVYQQPISIAMRKDILRIFNSREPDGNSYGEKARIIVMDSGFKEGIDLFDIKYIHIFEPQTTLADQKQVIGRGTRLCGQKGLTFHPTNGWNLYVNIYDSVIPEETQFGLMGAKTAFDLYMSSLGIDMRLVNLTVDMEKVCIEGSVDYALNRSIHLFKANNDGDYGYDDLIENESSDDNEHNRMTKYIKDNYSQYKWEDVKMENMCGGAPTVIKFTPTQDFIRHYFTPENDRKGVLLYNSVGTGKTCSAIATATSSFEKEGYTILWVTRNTLKNDIWKNMFDQVCSISIRDKIEAGINIPNIQKERMRLLSKAWSIRPMSYKQFSNLVSAKNSMHAALVKRNGTEDPLRKTLIIIDEAHKLYGDSGFSTLEQPDMARFYDAVTRSYEVSGRDSCRLMLMTATPITKSPLEIVKLLNLCRERYMRIEDDFETFAETYLDHAGHFTAPGRTQFLNNIAGYISYLNREKDARSFAQPIIKFIKVEMLDTPLFREYDARIMRKILQKNLDAAKVEVDREIKAANTLSNINNKNLNFLADNICNKYEPHLKTACKKQVSRKKQMLLQYVKGRKEEINNHAKTLKANLKNMSDERYRIIERIKENVERYKNVSANVSKSDEFEGGAKSNNSIENYENNPFLREIRALDNDYQKYVQSSFYNMKNKCVLQPSFKTFDTFYMVVDLKKRIEEIEAIISRSQGSFKSMIKNFKAGIACIKKNIKKSDDPVEKAELNLQLVSRGIEIKAIVNSEKKHFADFAERKKEEIIEITKQIRSIKMILLKKYRASLRLDEKERKLFEKEMKKIDADNEALDIALNGFKDLIRDDELKDVISQALAELEKEMEEIESNFEDKVIEEKAENERKAIQKARKAEENERKAIQKAEEKTRKTEEKTRKTEEKTRKAVQKTDEKRDKKNLRITKKNIRITKKNNK
jgi:hypothetical protein